MLTAYSLSDRRQIVLLAAALFVTLALLIAQVVRVTGIADDLRTIPMPPPTSQRVQQIGTAAEWFGPDSYPPGARRRGEQGRVQLRIGLDEEGRVRACQVEVSSGSRDLDDTSCRIFRQRARFEPVIGSDGGAIRVSIKRSVRWVLDDDAAARPAG